MADMKMQSHFILQELPNLLKKLHISQFKREKIAFEIFYADIDPNLILHIPIYTLYQVFSNLVINAIEALGNSEIKTIKMELRYAENDKSQILISITDTGHGITDEMRKKIFQIGVSTKESSGIGLPYAVEVVQSYGGSINLIHTGLSLPYKTTFIIQLPIKPIILTHKTNEN